MLRTFYLFTFLLTSSISWGHAFHVGLAKAEYNVSNKTMEVTLELESHDLEHWLEDKGLAVGHIEMVEKHSDLWNKMTTTLLNHFKANTNKQKLKFSVLGLETVKDGRVFIYLIAENVSPFTEIEWEYSLLMGHDMNQQNKLELTYNSKKYYAVFFEKKQSTKIIIE
jgi:hypothetical protein